MVILLLVGVSLQIRVADVPVIIKGEPRGAIIAFLLATLWRFAHIEWITALHTRIIILNHRNDGQEREPNEENAGTVVSAMRFQTTGSGTAVKSCRSPVMARLIMSLLLAVAVGLFLAGSSTEVVRFTSVLGGESVGCVRSYNLYTLGAELVSDFSLEANSAKPGTWTLFIAYILLLAVAPLFVHAVHILVFVLNVKHKTLCRIADISWTFASVDVLLVSVFTVQVRHVFWICLQ